RAVLFLGLVAVATPVVGRAVAGGQVHQVQCLVVGGHGPHVGGFQGELVVAGGCVLAFRRTDVPGPHQRTGQHVEGTHGARRLLGDDVAHPAADHGEVAHYHGQGGGVVALAVLGGAHAFFQVDITVVAKARA